MTCGYTYNICYIFLYCNIHFYCRYCLSLNVWIFYWTFWCLKDVLLYFLIIYADLTLGITVRYGKCHVRNIITWCEICYIINSRLLKFDLDKILFFYNFPRSIVLNKNLLAMNHLFWYKFKNNLRLIIIVAEKVSKYLYLNMYAKMAIKLYRYVCIVLLIIIFYDGALNMLII